MSHKFSILVVASLCAGAALASGAPPPRTIQEKIQELFTPPPPRTVEEKVSDADLIVRGKVTLFGEEKWVLDFVPLHNKAWFGLGNDPLPNEPLLPDTLYQHKLQVEVTEVLWPASLKGTTNIVFDFHILKKRPPRWACTNTPGIFFLVKAASPDRGEWTELERYDDWIEPTTNAPAVQAAVTKVKVRGEHPIRQPDGAANGSQPFRSDMNRPPSAAGSRR